MSSDAKNRVSIIITRLVAEHPFFGMLLASTNIFEDKTIQTAATNGIDIIYNSKFFDSLKDNEIRAVLFHELLHMIYSHCDKFRRGARDIQKWNQAADYCINLEIEEMRIGGIDIKLPAKRLLNNKYSNMYVEQIYDILPNDLNKTNFDAHIEIAGNDNNTQELADKILATYNMRKDSNDKLPKSIASVIKDINGSKISWARIFLRYLGSAINKNDYTYLQPNRRFLGQNLYLPSLGNPQLGKILFAPDVSGSIDNKTLGIFVNELIKISNLVSEIVVATWDTEITSWKSFKNKEINHKPKQFTGGGNTSIKCLFDEILKRKEIFDCIVILTDGDFNDLPLKNPIKMPIIFALTSDIDIKNNFGATIRIGG